MDNATGWHHRRPGAGDPAKGIASGLGLATVCPACNLIPVFPASAGGRGAGAPTVDLSTAGIAGHQRTAAPVHPSNLAHGANAAAVCVGGCNQLDPVAAAGDRTGIGDLGRESSIARFYYSDDRLFILCHGGAISRYLGRFAVFSALDLCRWGGGNVVGNGPIGGADAAKPTVVLLPDPHTGIYLDPSIAD